MECSCVQLLNLPDEILMIILKKLDNIEVLYSLMNINIRLNQIICDPVFTTQITLMERNSSIDLTSPLSEKILNRFCLEILPKIYQKIKSFNLETLSMERILLAVNNYPNLYQLNLFFMNEDIDMNFFTNKSLLHIFQNQITTLCVNGRQTTFDHSKINFLAKIFSKILLTFINIHHLKFYLSAYTGKGNISFANQFPTFSCTTLIELHMKVYRLDDCLFLLDGRLNQLRILFLTTFHILPLQSTIINKINYFRKKKKLCNLKHFSLTCISETFLYDELIVPLLQRMINLEKLALYFTTDYYETYIDGNNLKKNIINHMPQLNEFIFNIRSIIHYNDQISLVSNENIYRTFRSFENYKIISCVDYFPKARYGQCHIYSYPYTLTSYDNITNNFLGGLFNNVQDITLFDERPFQHEFFLKISQSFPFVKKLTLANLEAQNSNNDNQTFPVIEYSHLTGLCFLSVHDDYVKQFLFDTITYIPNNIRLAIRYNQLQRVTHNFTRDETRNNCSKIKTLSLDFLQLPEHYRTYFPNLE